MDPVTIAATSAALVKLCFQVSISLATFFGDVKGTRNAVHAFQNEINHLSNLLDCIGTSFQSEEYKLALTSAPTGHEILYWQCVSGLMKDCEWTLERLAILLRQVKVEQRSFLSLSRAKIKLDINSTEITALREEIKFYAGMMNISLSMINLSLLLSRPESRPNALASLSHWENEITELHLSLRQHVETTTSELNTETNRSQTIHNVKKCITSARMLLSTASSVFSDSQIGSVTYSEVEDKFHPNKAMDGIDGMSESKTSNLESQEPGSNPQDGYTRSPTGSNPILDLPKEKVEAWLKNTDESKVVQRSPASTKSISIRPTSIDSRSSQLQQTYMSTREPATAQPFQHRQSPQVKKFIDENNAVGRLWRDGGKEEAADLAVEFLKGIVPQGISDLKWDDIKNNILRGKGNGFADSGYGFTVLHLLAAKGLDQYMKVLLQRSASVEARDKDNCTPLHFAAWSGHQTSCELLITHGASSVAKSRSDCIPLHFAAREGHTNVVKLLIDANTDTIEAKDWRLRTPLCCACARGQLETARFLLDNRAEFEVKSVDQWTPFHYVCQSGSTDIAKLLISRDANVAAKTNDGCTPLHICCRQGYYSLVELLLKTTDVKARDGDGRTALHLTCRNGHDRVASLLLRHGADIEAQSKHGYTPLHTTCEHGQLSTANLLLENRANAGAKDKKGRTPLYIACRSNHEALARLLISKSQTVNVATKQKYAPLHTSSENGFTSIVALLLEARADIGANTADGFTPLYCAARNDHAETVSLLIKKGADVEAAEAAGKYTPLHIACQNGKLATIEILIKHGADIRAKDKNHRTPLRLACEYGHKEVVSFLLEKNANIEAKSKFEYTPLHSSCQNGDLKIAELLVQNGADVRARTIDGKTPLSLAKKYKHEKIVALLKGEMEKNP